MISRSVRVRHVSAINSFYIVALTALGLLTISGNAIAGNTTYQYDALGRVVKVTYPDSKQICYRYDDAGNRTHVQQQATSTCTPPATTLMTNSVATLQAEEAAMFGPGTLESATIGQATTTDQAVSEPTTSDAPSN